MQNAPSQRTIFDEAKRNTRFISALWVCLTVQGVPVAAEDVPQDTVDTFDYFVVNQSVVAFLDLLSHDTNTNIDVTSMVRGTIRSRAYQGNQTQVLAQLSSDFDLNTFVFNEVSYVSAKRESVTRLIRLGNLSKDRATAALEEAGLMSGAFPVRSTADGTALVLSGPPQFLGLSEAVIESIPDLTITAVRADQVRVRRANSLTYESTSTTDDSE